MQHSEAVATAVRAWCERMSAGDVGGVSDTLSDDPEAFAIGTQRIGPDRDAWLQSVDEMAALGVQWEWSSLCAWEAGDAGFAAGEITASIPEGPTLPMRATAFVVREGDAYRVFNIHFSWAVPDEVAMPHVGAWQEQLAAV